MAKGIAMPPRAVGGRLALVSGKDQLSNVIMLAAGSSDTDNPFLEAGIEHPLFSLNDGVTRATIRRQMKEHFDRLSRAGRAVLDDITFEDRNGELYVLVRYRDLETGEIATVSAATSATE